MVIMTACYELVIKGKTFYHDVFEPKDNKVSIYTLVRNDKHTEAFQ